MNISVFSVHLRENPRTMDGNNILVNYNVDRTRGVMRAEVGIDALAMCTLAWLCAVSRSNIKSMWVQGKRFCCRRSMKMTTGRRQAK